jgi:putative FmdB family regulatory protein
MPTYDYHCTACDHEFEHFQSINSPVLRKCPACNKLKLQRLIGAGAAVVFKGSGFYQTDYRSESYKKGAAAEKKAAAPKKDSGKSEKVSPPKSKSKKTSSSPK